MLAASVVALALPATAAAATKPVARTGAASNVGQQDAALNGTVNPKGAATVYFFQYGVTKAYTATTPETAVGAGTAPVKVTMPVGALAPATTYHYRLVARNAQGQTLGEDRAFKTQRQPLGVTLAANPGAVRPGGETVLAGALTGTGSGGRQVVLQSNPWPYTQGFLSATNPQVTDAAGNFSFPILSVPVNTQYRVLMPSRPEIASPVVIVGANVRVTTHVKVTRGERRGTVRLSGALTPAVDGTQVLIQKFVDEKWTTIASTVARHSSASTSRYSKSVRQRRPGRYRVFVNAQGAYTANLGRTLRVRDVRR